MAINPGMIFADAAIQKQLAGGGLGGAGDLATRLAAMANSAAPAATSGLVADPNAPVGVQTLGAPAPAPGMVGVTNAAPGVNDDRAMQPQRPQFGSYIPQGLVRMLMRMQQNPEQLAALFGRQPGFVERFGLTPQTDFGNLYTRQMARQDYRGGTDPLAAGTVLSPEQRAGYGAWPDYRGGAGNQAPDAQGRNKPRPLGMAERTPPPAAATGNSTTY